VEVAQVVQTIRLALQTPCSASFLHVKSRKSSFLSLITGILRTIDLHVIVEVRDYSERMRGKANQRFDRHFQYMKMIQGAQNQSAKRIYVRKNKGSFSESSIVQYAVPRSLCCAQLAS
jgi:hypothetical protein